MNNFYKDRHQLRDARILISNKNASWIPGLDFRFSAIGQSINVIRTPPAKEAKEAKEANLLFFHRATKQKYVVRHTRKPIWNVDIFIRLPREMSRNAEKQILSHSSM